MAHLLSSRSRIWREAAILVPVLFLATSLAIVLPAQDSQTSAPESAPAPAPAAASDAAPAAAHVAKHAAKAGGKGAEIFTSKCLICHNKKANDNSPFGPPNLFIAFKTKAITTAQAEQIILNGKGQMPAWAKLLSKSDIQSVIAYLKAGPK